MHLRHITTVFTTTLILFYGSLSAHADIIIVTLDYDGTSNSNDLHDTVFRESVVRFSQVSAELAGRASVQSLGLDINARSTSSFPFAPLRVSDRLEATVMFESDPGITSALVSWDARVRGTVSGTLTDNVFNIGTGVGATLMINNNVSAGLNETYQLAEGAPPIEVDTTLIASGLVPTNVPISISASFGAGIFNLRDFDTIHVNFLNSMSFDTDSFFDIQTAGVTVNSVGSDWLVNNRVTTVPEPLPFGLGIIALLGMSLRRRRRS